MMRSRKGNLAGTWFKRTLLFVAAGAVALTWTGRGQTAGCFVERGLDPLDVLNTGVRHNVWIALDTSGSMRGGFQGAGSKFHAARETIHLMLNQLVDASGKPIVNWGFTYFDMQFSRSKATKCAEAPDSNGDGLCDTPSNCEGMDDNRVDPPACGGADPRDVIRQELDALANSDGSLKDNARGTPNGVMLDELSTHIQNYTAANPLFPNQKNFIILLTDGDDTCECYNNVWDDPNLDVTTDTELRLRGMDNTSDRTHALTPYDPNHPQFNSHDGSPHQRDVAAYNAGLKGQVSYRRMDPNLDGSLGDIFVIGAGIGGRSEVRTHHLAWEASGVSDGRPGHPAFLANSKDKLISDMEDIFSRIGVPRTEVSLGASVVGSVKELVNHQDGANPAVSTSELLSPDPIDRHVLATRSQYRNNVLFTTSVETPGFRGHLRANNIYQVQSDGTRRQHFRELWDAGEVLQQRDLVANPRRILFNRAPATLGSGPMTPEVFDVSNTNLTAADLGVSAGFLKEVDPAGIGARSDDDARDIVVKVIQGWRLVSFDPLTFSQFEADGTTGTWKLYDPANSAPAVVLNPPRSAEIDPPAPATEYATFFEDYVNRMTMVYLGTNGGMLHGFRADNGHEVFGYIPHDFLPRLKDLVENVVKENNGIQNHQYFVAAAPTVQDAYLQPGPQGSAWRTVVAFGRGQGGKFLTALDVTDVGDWNGSSNLGAPTGYQDPVLLFNVGNTDGVADLDPALQSYDELGETWSIPVMGRVRNPSGTPEGKWVLFAGSGYGCENTAEGHHLYVLELENGRIYYKSPVIQDVVAPGDEGIDRNALVATPAVYNPHDPGVNDGRDFVERVYIGDLQGFVYKLVCTDGDPGNWDFFPFFEVTSDADQGPGTGLHNQPITAQAGVLKLFGTDQILIFVGTGGDQRVPPPIDHFKLVGLVDSDANASAAGQLIQTTDSGPFFFDVAPEERVSVGPVTAKNLATEGVVFFASSRQVFSLDTCTSSFFSTLYAIGAKAGLGSYDLDPTTPGADDTVTDIEGKITGLFHRDEHLYVSKSGGIGVDAGTDVIGREEFPQPNIAHPGSIQVLVDSFRVSPF